MIEKFIHGQKVLYNAMAKIAGFFVMGAALMACVNVISRYGFHHSFDWAEELCTYIIVLVVFQTFAWLETEDQQLCIDLITSVVKNQKVLLFLHVLRGILTLIITGLLVKYGWDSMMTAYRLGTSTYVLLIPRYIMYIFVLFGYVCVMLGWLSVLLLNKGRKF